MTDKAVLLSDIEFVEMHSDDWERIERESFEIQKQPQINENQQIVLEWLKEYMLDDSDFYNTVYASKQLYSYGVPYGEESEAFTKLSNRELAQVLELFSKWALEQEEE
ncbi:hypothetical protein HCG83_13165 [Enterococcus casseliflavus]|uniref:hypothetical protein n=1 Tax=Enterococcus casseliflavus TaxID=37734 RepID=UPI001C8CF2AC|nr:hypothetical protein [Enterococcus casseliflavus]MBX9117254.1 hypothetical protein [Enterococcus casseliflavus]MBX9127720.1 hypothetical protein [Enterococcus casseliflavus]